MPPLSAILRRLLPRRGVPIRWVTPYLAVGPAFETSSARRLAAEGIAAVVDLRATENHDASRLAEAGLQLLHLPVPDRGAPTIEQLEGGTSWVQTRVERGVPVLIHCRGGQGRSVVMACAVLLRMGYPLSMAHGLVQQATGIVAPTDRQLAALVEFSDRLRQKTGPVDLGRPALDGGRTSLWS
ncbi:MAG: protein phosphatase [Dehalococcoidia bacterium]|nr:protein phosphatase [Dehalococcoidia bacterium]